MPERTIAQQLLFDWQLSSEAALRAALRLWSGSGRMIPAAVKFRVGTLGVLGCESGWI